MFAHVVLVDELNRTPPRTQSVLLETMEGTAGQRGRDLLATTPAPHGDRDPNPLSQRGTYPLVESQLDRFALSTAVGYPDAESEARLVVHEGGKWALGELGPVCTTSAWLDAQRAVETLPVAPAVARYAIELCRASRRAPGVRLGASPRAAIWLIRCAQAYAVLSGRDYVAPDDVKAVTASCLTHRLLTDNGPGQQVGCL